jgi:transposase
MLEEEQALFISDTLIMCVSRQETGDYHKEMYSTNYAHWLKTMLIPNLPPNCVLVIDNASYHNVQTDKLLTSNLKKDEMKAWQLERNIPFCDMLKAQLYDLIKLNKPKH